MSTERLTGEQVIKALQILKDKGVSGNAFCALCNVAGSNQSYWRKFGMTGTPVVILKQNLSVEEFNNL